MAEAEAAETGAKSKKKLFVIIGIVVLALLIGGGAAFFLLGGEPSEEEPAEAVKLPALYQPLGEPIITTYSYKNRDRFMQVTFSVMARSQSVLDAVTLHMPTIRNRLISELGKMDFEQMQTDSGRLAILSTSKEVINTVLKNEAVEGEVEQVLFMNLVLQ
ncbi:flagellar basal body-associated FliL family protein [Allohahella sp. A8]|uniref:flagellar basal body-associated FliL family protein n=1 Tax=Allohahella sp. A8 TaxID=3141461 RepID=UPI003A811D84